MERFIRTIIGLSVIAASVWLAVVIERGKKPVTVELAQNSAVGYADSTGETVTPECDSTLIARPYLQMRDGTRTLNNICPVRGERLNKRIQPVFVNGSPIGFC